MIANTRTGINTCAVYDMRQSGASLQQIADKIGRTKEGVRQILIKNYGSAEHKLLSTEQFARLLGLHRNRILELYQHGVIIPAAEWNTGNGHYLLWSLATVEQVISYYKTHRLCKICRHPIPKDRWVYCSEECFIQGQKNNHKNRRIQNKQSYKIGLIS